MATNRYARITSPSQLELLLRDVAARVLGEHTAKKLKILLFNGWRYKPILGFIDIEGWLSRVEALTVYDLALSLPDQHPVVVEIGSWAGKSSMVLAKGIVRKVEPILYCIDPFNAESDLRSKSFFPSSLSRLSVSLKDTFVENMRRNHVEHVIRVLQGYSYEFSQNFDQAIDFLFIDGNHEREAVLRDYLEWSRWVKPGGILGFHDAAPHGHFPGPWAVVEQNVLHNPQWENPMHADTLFVVRKSLRATA